ncbi:MAG TPA: hypothetical protein VMU12_02110 [Candidatus Paceibacterota bacterium]|nr:hypothetical protein [Candidatus Paceibacterota bacterium]
MKFRLFAVFLVLFGLLVAVPAMAFVPCDTGMPRTSEIISLGNGNYEFAGSIMESAWAATLKDFRRQHPGLAVSGIKIGSSKYLDGCSVNELRNITFHTSTDTSVSAQPVRLVSADIKPPARHGHSQVYALKLTFVDGNETDIPFILGTWFRFVEDAELDGTYAKIERLAAGMKCTIYVRTFNTKQAWETILSRYEKRSEQLAVDVTPVEPVGF